MRCHGRVGDGRVKQVDTCEDWHMGLQQQSSAGAMASVTPAPIFCLLSLFEAPVCQHKPLAVCRTASEPYIVPSPEDMVLQPDLMPSMQGMRPCFSYEANQVWQQLLVLMR